MTVHSGDTARGFRWGAGRAAVCGLGLAILLAGWAGAACADRDPFDGTVRADGAHASLGAFLFPECARTARPAQPDPAPAAHHAAQGGRAAARAPVRFPVPRERGFLDAADFEPQVPARQADARQRAGRGPGVSAYSLSDALREAAWRKETVDRLRRLSRPRAGD